jgi:hypothetical protein
MMEIVITGIVIVEIVIVRVLSIAITVSQMVILIV